MSKIELKNISKIYKNGVTAVKNISFEVNEGEFIILVGPSGCGKTTLLRMIAGLEEISSGVLLFNGKQMNNIEPKDRDIGMVFQEYALYPHFTVFDNIAFPLKIRKVNKSEIKKQVEEVADIVELSECLCRKPAELSGGQRQRVALARAIIRKPKLFLFDEPLSNLDAKLRVQMRHDIINLQRKLGVTSIYVTHDQVEAMTMGSKLAVLKNGVMQQFDTPYNIYNSPKNIFVADFIGAPQINLFKGKINNNTFIGADNSIIFHLNLEIQDGEYTIGVRPEKIFIGQCEQTDILINNIIYTSGSIENVEYLGNEVYIYIKPNNSTIRVKTHMISEMKNLHIGENIHIYFHREDINIFDATGNHI